MTLFKNLSTAERVRQGKEFERNILEELKILGNVETSSLQEDTKFKLDGFITFTDSRFENLKGKLAVQVKQRVQTGDDILLEVKKDFDKDIIGRDIKGESQIYVVANRKGQIGVFETVKLKEKISTLLEKGSQKLQEFKDNNVVGVKTTRNGLTKGLVAEIDGAQLWVTEGNPAFREGERKLIAFINFETANPLTIL
jgi:hypothetical protein